MRNILILTMLTSSLLIACEESSEDVSDTNIGEEISEQTESVEVEDNKDEIIANIEDLEGATYQNDNMQFIKFEGDKLIIHGSFSYEEYEGKTDIDFIMEAEGRNREDRLDKTFENIEIQTSGVTFYITSPEGLELKFEKIGPRILKDSRGYRYYQVMKE